MTDEELKDDIRIRLYYALDIKEMDDERLTRGVEIIYDLIKKYEMQTLSKRITTD